MRFLTRSLIGVFLLALTVGLLSYAGSMLFNAVSDRLSKEAPSRPARERVFAANVQSLEPETVVPVLTAFGEIRSRRTLDLRAPIGGTVVSVDRGFEEGGQVEAGTVLIEIDPADAETARDKSATDVAEAEADLRDATRTAALSRDEVAASERQVALRKQALDRQQNLLDRGVGTEAALEVAALAEASASQALVSRRQALAQAEARIDQTTTRLERRRIELAEAERNLEDTRIVAEFDGTLSDTAAVQGGLLAANERVAQLIDPTALEVAFRVSAAQHIRLLDETGRLRPLKVNLSLDVLGLDLVTTATLTRESASVAEGQTGRLLFAQLDAAPGFRPGDFVTVRVSEPPLSGVVRIPSAAIDPQGNVLALTDDDRLESLSVTVLRRQGNEVLVDAKGHLGREIVMERSPLLGDGIKIRPVRPGAEVADTPELVELDDERRARLVAFVESNTRMPEQAKQRILGQLAQDKVPASMVARLEGRMGG